MVDVVPSALQHLRAADIIRMAGLSVAALGQEYSRRGAVHTTNRQGARLSGIVDVSPRVSRAANEVSENGFSQETSLSTVDRSITAREEAASPTKSAQEIEHVETERRQYHVEVEIHSSTSWSTNCPCGLTSPSLCQHAAALLYQWVNHPTTFVPPSFISPTGPLSFSASSKNNGTPSPSMEQRRRITAPLKQGQPQGQAEQSITEILGLQGVSDLRGIAKEYDINTTGLSKQQLLDAVSETLRRPEAIKRVVSTLEKPQRQLLATLALAGGSMNDEDLRGLAERFSLGTPAQLQNMLATLQKKALIFRTSVGADLSRPLQRAGVTGIGTAFDVTWHIPSEVRNTLRVTLPITPFDVQKGAGGKTEAPIVQQVEPYGLLADLLLVARALNGQQLEYENPGNLESQFIALPPGGRGGEHQNVAAPLVGAVGGAARDGSAAIPPPEERPAASFLKSLQTIVPRPLPFLRFAIRLLRLTDILYKEEGATSSLPSLPSLPTLRTLPNAAQLLLGPERTEVADDLFELWLTQPTYEELFDLQEEGLRLRCRTTLTNQPALRPTELAVENSEARQTLITLLAQAPLNQWISFSAFARFIYRLNPTFLQKKQRLFLTPHWWLEQEEGRPLRPTQFNDWQRAEGRYLTQLLQGPLHWWGVCDLAVSRNGDLLAFRLTPLAGLLLGSTSIDEQHLRRGGSEVDAGWGPLWPPASLDMLPTVEVLQSGEILIPSTPAAWPLIEPIEVFAEVHGVRAGQLCYRLAPKSLSDALSRGEHPVALLDLLRHTTGNVGASAALDHPPDARLAERVSIPSPPTADLSAMRSAPSGAPFNSFAPKDSPLARLLAQLEGWTANYGRVRLYTGVTLLEAADTLVMRELSATTSLEEQIVKTIHPTLLILKSQGAERIIEELKRRGQSPLVHEEVDDATE